MAGLPIGGHGKFRDDHGGTLTTVIAYNAFFAFFPLLLVVVTALGFLLGRDSGLQQRLLSSAVADFPIIGDQLQDNIHGLRGSGVGLVIGLAAFAWGARGLTQVTQHAMAEIWNIPGRQRPRFWARQLRGLLLLVVFAVGLAATSLLTWLGSYGGKAVAVALANLAVAAAVNVGLFLLAFRVLTPQPVPTRQLVAGGGYLGAAQPGDAAPPRLGKVGFLWRDLGASRGEELSDFGTVVHANYVTTEPAWLGCPVSTPINRDFSLLGGRDFLAGLTSPDPHYLPLRRRQLIMRVAVMHAPGDVRAEDRPEPTILAPTDAIIRLAATCICGSDLWPYRGVEPIDGPRPMGHEYAGVVEEVGSAVTMIKPGQFVVGSFFASDNICEICQAGYQSSCIHREPGAPDGAQAERMRVPLADGTLVPTPGIPDDDLIPSLLAASDVLGTGWFAAVAAEAGPGKTVAVVGDGAVGLLGVLAAQQLGADRIIAMSRHQPRQQLALDYGATDIVTERGDAGVAKIKDLIEAVGTQESMMQAIRSTRPGGHVGYVGVNHNVSLPGEELFFSHVHLHGGPAPVPRFLPDLIDRIWNRQVDPGKVFDLELPLDQAAACYHAMDNRQAIKVLLRPESVLTRRTGEV